MGHEIKISEKPFLVMKLRTVLAAAGISHAQYAEELTQIDGKSFSRSAVSLLLCHSMWPRKTTRASIENQTRIFLRRHHIAEADDHDLFESTVNPMRSAEPLTHASVPNTGNLISTATNLPPLEHLEPVMLSPQARRHFKLFRDPFNTDPQCAEDVFRGPDQQFAAESIWEAARHARLFALVGESGSGKTTLMDDFRDRVRHESLPVRLIQPMLPEKNKLTGTGILEAIVRDLAPNVTLRGRIEGLTRQAHELLADSAEAGLHNVLIFEEAHDLSIYALKQLKRFHEFKTGWRRLMSIILVGQPELMTKLGEHATGEAREVARRLEIMKLLPLDNDLPDYVSHKLVRASSSVEAVFAEGALSAAQERLRTTQKSGMHSGAAVSMSYPLLVNNLLVKAMNTAAELGAPRVDANIVKGC